MSVNLDKPFVLVSQIDEKRTHPATLIKRYPDGSAAIEVTWEHVATEISTYTAAFIQARFRNLPEPAPECWLDWRKLGDGKIHAFAFLSQKDARDNHLTGLPLGVQHVVMDTEPT